MIEQKTKTSKGCPYSCPFCFNGKNDFIELKLPKIKSNYVKLLDDAFLSRKNVYSDLIYLRSKKINKKVVYYELVQGINLKDLTPSIAHALKISRFVNIRFAWDGSYSKKNMQRVLDGIKMLVDAGYKEPNLMCFILSNYYISIRECLYKSKIMLSKNVQVSNCVFRKNYLDSTIYPEQWTVKQIDYFRQECRFNNQIIRTKGYDSEIETRLIRCKQMPNLKILTGKCHNIKKGVVS